MTLSVTECGETPHVLSRSLSRLMVMSSQKKPFGLEFEGRLGILQDISRWKGIPRRINKKCRGMTASECIEDLGHREPSSAARAQSACQRRRVY